MSTIKFELQKELFERVKERLHGVLPVYKVGRSKKTAANQFLSITGSIERPIRFNIYLIKRTEKGFKRKQEWMLSNLKEANYRSNDSTEFDFQLDKNYQWNASSLQEKEIFFSMLYQICSRIHRPPKFLNYEPVEEDERNAGYSLTISSVPKEEIGEGDENEQYGLTEREEIDLEKVLARAENAVLNAEAYMEQLAKELSILDGENIHSIMESEGQVNFLMNSIDVSIGALEELESELTSYEESFSGVRKSVEKIEEENLQMGVVARNNILLLEELANLIDALDFSEGAQLLSVDLGTDDGIQLATKYAFQLQQALQVQNKIHPTLLKLNAVEEQKKNLERIQKKFGYNLGETFTSIYVETWNNASVMSSRSNSISSLQLPRLKRTHNALRKYEELSRWLKQALPEVMAKILQGYTAGLRKLYDESIKELFKEAVRRISSNSSAKLYSSSADLQMKGRFFGKTRILANRDFDTESQSSNEGSIDSAERLHFYDILEQLLYSIAGPVNEEENFLVTFFHLEGSSSGAVSPLSGNSPGKVTSGGGADVRKILSSIFGTIETELVQFLTNYEKLEPSFCMGAMVKLGHHALKPENASCYISVIYGTVLIQEKRSFDRLMSSYVQAIAETRVSKKSKSEILTFVTEFEDFAVMAENIFENSPRRSELEKWYIKMLNAIFEGILRHSNESGKIPGEVLKMENFHRLHAILSKLKVTAMENHKKDAKGKYAEALNAYVTKYLGRPLSKLNDFFDGVQLKVSQGVKESEIGYQMSFSRTELKRVIKEYPAKEVKKGLESLYKRVEKHLSDEENLLQVVWRAMQEEFIVQYKTFEGLIARCYPGSKITLEFTIEDILDFFSEIAQTH